DENVSPIKDTMNTDEGSNIEVDSLDSKVYIDFRDADIKDVARTFADLGDRSILVADGVTANVTLHIEGLSWESALDLILKTYGLAKIEKDNYILIVTYEKIQQEMEKSPLDIKIIKLNFVSTEEAKTYLKSIQSDRGSIEGDVRTNSLIIMDVPENIEKMTKIVTELDEQTTQVLIEVLMVDKKITDDFNFGIEWSFADKKASDVFATDAPESLSDLTTIATQSLSSTGTIGLTYGNTIFSHAWLEAAVQMLETEEKANIIASPKVITLNNESAEINITEDVPYTYVQTDASGSSDGTTSTQFKSVGIAIKVNPHITPNHKVILELETEQSFVAGYTASDEQPITNSRITKTKMIVGDGRTIVIGGMRRRDVTKTESYFPILGHLPLIGRFFHKTIDEDVMREVLIFVTPTILHTTDEQVDVEKKNKKLKKDDVYSDKVQNLSNNLLNFPLERDLSYKVKDYTQKNEEVNKKDALENTVGISQDTPTLSNQVPSSAENKNNTPNSVSEKWEDLLNMIEKGKINYTDMDLKKIEEPNE
ncbi:MAG: secretin N-terminal domain-containing protein, partial [Candidatus Omnitrophota bacterium]